jgi:XrtJ-associated TM-motif-TM protein
MRRLNLLLLLSLMAVALPLRAQVTGCDDSPENPTVILAVVGGIGVVVARLRAGRRR